MLEERDAFGQCLYALNPTHVLCKALRPKIAFTIRCNIPEPVPTLSWLFRSPRCIADRIPLVTWGSRQPNQGSDKASSLTRALGSSPCPLPEVVVDVGEIRGGHNSNSFAKSMHVVSSIESNGGEQKRPTQTLRFVVADVNSDFC
jgi:hypothetical protein